MFFFAVTQKTTYTHFYLQTFPSTWRRPSSCSARTYSTDAPLLPRSSSPRSPSPAWPVPPQPRPQSSADYSHSSSASPDQPRSETAASPDTPAGCYTSRSFWAWTNLERCSSPNSSESCWPARAAPDCRPRPEPLTAERIFRFDSTKECWGCGDLPSSRGGFGANSCGPSWGPGDWRGLRRRSFQALSGGCGSSSSWRAWASGGRRPAPQPVSGCSWASDAWGSAGPWRGQALPGGCISFRYKKEKTQTIYKIYIRIKVIFKKGVKPVIQ